MWLTWNDLRYAWRQLRRNPGFALTSVLVLGLGIGVGTAMFSVLDAVLLRPLPYSHPEQLVTLEHPRDPGNIAGQVSGPDTRDWQRDSHSFAGIAYAVPRLARLRLASETDGVEDVGASANLFTTLGVPPRLGRGLLPDDQSSHARVAVLSDAVWRRFFGGRANAVGETIQLDGVGFTVVGVMPSGFSFPYGEAALWTPYGTEANSAAGSGDDARDANLLTVIARLRPGVQPLGAQAEVSAIQANIARQYGDLHLSPRVLVQGYHEELVAGVRPALLALAGAVGLVWLIACLSVAGLLLTRLAARRRELAVRSALGAGQRRLAGQLLTESLLLGSLAGAAGVALAYAGVASLRHFMVSRLPVGMRVHLSWGVLLGLLGVTLLSVLLIGLAPALLAARGSAQEGLRGGAASASRRQSRLRDGLVVGEIALALVLLTSAGLLLRTLYTLRQVPLGFATENVVTTHLEIPSGRFDKQNMQQVFDQPLLARLAALPGVAAAAITSVVPLQRGFTMTGRFRYVDRPNLPAAQQPQGNVRFASAGYAAVFGIPLERGRFFDPGRDTLAAPRVIVVNHAFAAKYFPGENAVGRQISIGKKVSATIIGVLADVHNLAVNAPPGPEMFFSTTQIRPDGDFYPMAVAFADLAVRTRTSPATLIPAIRATLYGLAPDLATGDFSGMRQLVADSMGDQVFAARLLGLFALAALLIALTGLYGLLAYSVAQRTREMGIRMALGAERRQILALVLGRAAWLLGIGIAAGLGLALLLSRLLAAYLYGVPARDPLTLASVALLLGAAGLWAGYLPARRAARVSPVAALRAE